MLRLVEDAHEAGQDVTFDSYPYIYGSTRLTIMLPDWTHDGGPERVKQVIGSSEGRERLKREVGPYVATWHDIWLTYFQAPAEPRLRGTVGRRDIGDDGGGPGRRHLRPADRRDLQTNYVAAGANGNTLPAFVTHPLSMVGSDAVLLGDFPSPRTYGCFPVILAEYVREERQMSLPDAIRKMTSFPAQRLGIQDRGVLRDGMKADITVFDPDRVSAPATRSEPKRFPVGIEYVIVNGTVVVDRGHAHGRAARPRPKAERGIVSPNNGLGDWGLGGLQRLP